MKKNTNKYIIKKKIDEVIFLKNKVFFDSRGEFQEVFKNSEFNFLSKNFIIKQINVSRSHLNVARGLHLQIKPNQSKIMRVIKGKAILFSLDCRKKNINNKIVSYISDEKDNTLVYAPYYYARGFISLEKNTTIEYFCDHEYNPKNEYSINMLDKNLDIKVKKIKYLRSSKDKNSISIDEFKKLNIL